MLVFDSSAVIACIAPDEKAPEAWHELLAQSPLVCPALWPSEVMNALVMGVRRRRFTDADSERMVTVVKNLSVEIESSSVSLYAGPVLTLARKHRLTVYDAAYLELAVRRRLPLATLDGPLAGAARKARVKLL